MCWQAVLVFFYLVLTNVSAEDDYRIVCYYSNWAQFRHGKAKFVPENMDPSFCTHLVYASAYLNVNHETQKVEIKASEWNDESTGDFMGMYEKFQKIGHLYSNVKVLLAVDGWNKLTNFRSTIFLTPEKRKQFATDAAAFLRQHNFDGIDMQYKYEDEDYLVEDKIVFVRTVETVKDTFTEEATKMNRSRLLVVVSTNVAPTEFLPLNAGLLMCRHIDFLNLMVYRFHGPWDNFTGHFSPLFQRISYLRNNVNSAMKSWNSLSCPKEKLNLGIALFGRSYNLTSSKDGINAPAVPGRRGLYTQTEGFLAHYEICKMKTNYTKEIYIKDERVFYMVHGNQWVAYENDRSIRIKVCYTKEGRFGGVMIWAVDLDDFNGEFCGKGKWPMLKAVKDQMEGRPPCEPVTNLTLDESAEESSCVDTAGTKAKYGGSPTEGSHMVSTLEDVAITSDALSTTFRSVRELVIQEIAKCSSIM